jgi:hypothetical protein
VARHESKLYQDFKKITPTIRWTRLENWASFGTPDLLGYSPNSTFFTVELKVSKSNKVALSPHQVAWHVRHPSGSFVLVRYIDKKIKKNFTCSLYPGSEILNLVRLGLVHEPLVRGSLEACACSLLERVGGEPVPVV